MERVLWNTIAGAVLPGTEQSLLLQHTAFEDCHDGADEISKPIAWLVQGVLAAHRTWPPHGEHPGHLLTRYASGLQVHMPFSGQFLLASQWAVELTLRTVILGRGPDIERRNAVLPSAGPVAALPDWAARKARE